MTVARTIRKYFIMGSQNCHRDPLAILEEAIAGGITAFQFREKGDGALSGKDKIQLGKAMRDLCRLHQIPFFINDDVELIDLLDADGIHVGQGDHPVESIREQYPDILIGLSVSNEAELRKSRLDLVDYIGAGPVFTTKTKVDAKEPVGLAWIRYLRKRHPHLPIVGIGGIKEDNAQQVLQAGADGVSFITAVTEAKDIGQSLARL